jgi:hypothetical protein
MDLAGVDSGAKIFVRPVDGSASAAAAAVAMNKNKSVSTKSALNLTEFSLRCICVNRSLRIPAKNQLAET